MVRFQPGFCFSAVALDGATKLAVNVCGHDSVGGPLAKNMSLVDERYLDERGIDNLIVPISVGQPIKLEQGEEYNFRVDVVVHTWFTKRCQLQHHFFKEFVSRLMDLATDWVRQECGIVLAPDSRKVLGLFLYSKGTQEAADSSSSDLATMAEEVLNSLRASCVQPPDAEKQNARHESCLLVDVNLSKDAGTKPAKPLVQEVVETPGIRKGFLLGGHARLYGEGGTPEGERTEPDPLAHIPKSIRDKCKVIDTRQMDSASIQREVMRQQGQALYPPDGVSVVAPENASSKEEHLKRAESRWTLSSVATANGVTVLRLVTAETIKGVADVELSVDGTSVDVDDFHYTLSSAVVEDGVKAKFVKSTKTLVLTCPLTT